jgi:AAA family ATP:ADP antiporter
LWNRVRTRIGSALARLRARTSRGLDVRVDERAAVVLSFLYFTTVMTGWFALRALRDDSGSAVPREERPILYTWTFVGALVLVPTFSWLVSRFDRRKLLPWVYEFFCLNLLLFWLCGRLGYWQGSVDRVFFVWTSVYSLFVVSVFWSVMVDVFDEPQGRRLFGLISAGGSLGTLLGSELTKQLLGLIGRGGLYLVAAGLLQVCVVCVWLVRRNGTLTSSPSASARGGTGGTGGSAWAGFTLTLRRPYLMALAMQTLCITMGSTFLYNEKLTAVAELFPDRDERAHVFAQIDQATNLVTMLAQGLLTAFVLRRLGLAFALGFLPVLGAIGFAVLAVLLQRDALQQVLWFVIAFELMRRASHHALEKPSREVLFTVVSREEKYKAKDFLDVAVYRGGDSLGGWIYEGLRRCGPAAPAWFAIPLSAVALGVSGYLARSQQRMAKEQADARA